MRSRAYGRINPHRVRVVVCTDPATRFAVWRGVALLGEFPTHAEAMTWATREAGLVRVEDCTWDPDILADWQDWPAPLEAP